MKEKCDFEATNLISPLIDLPLNFSFDALRERIKELNCLHQITEALRRENSIDSSFEQIVNIIPPGWQYPEITCCRIKYRSRVWESNSFKESKWILKSDLCINGRIEGSISVFYMEEKPQLFEGPFFKEEKRLLTSISNIICDNLERIIALESTRSLAKFPQENPFPVLRISLDGKVLYRNSAALVFFEEKGGGEAGFIDSYWHDSIKDRLDESRKSQIEFASQGKTFLLSFVPVKNEKYVNIYATDISKLKEAEKEKSSYCTEIKNKNIALNEIILQMNEQKEEFVKNIALNIETYIKPALTELTTKYPKEKLKLELIKDGLENLTSEFHRKMVQMDFGMTSAELSIAKLIRRGLRNKEIANVLNISISTVKCHKYSISKKLGLTKSGMKLSAYLRQNF